MEQRSRYTNTQFATTFKTHKVSLVKVLSLSYGVFRHLL